jgi:hypothetical protein
MMKHKSILLIAIIIVGSLAVLVSCTKSGPAGPPVENYPGVIGWEADQDGVIAYYDGSFYVRDGKEKRYSFGVYNQPQTMKWYNDEGFLPALVTEFERDNATITIINFGNKVSLNGKDYVAVYSRVAVYNHGSETINLSPAPSEGLVALTQSAAAVQPGQTANHDYVVAADRFGNDYGWPSDAELA